MRHNKKHNVKKYIAGILTIALAAGVCQSYGSMEVSAQEMTLPGIEKLVKDTVASADGTFHILEIVPSKSDASIGYLIGGEEPVSAGRKLSELPAASERSSAMAGISSSSLGDLAGSNGPVSFSAYGEGGSRTEEIRGSFVKNTEDNGQYTYVQTDPVYQLYTQGDTGQRYDRYGAIEVSGTSNANNKSVSPVFSKVSGISGQNLEMTIGDTTETALAATRYALTPYDTSSDGSMNKINSVDFKADTYVGREVYTKGTDDVYTYLGKIVFGKDLPAGYTAQSGEITSVISSEVTEDQEEDTNAETPEQTADSVSGNDAEAESEEVNEDNELTMLSVESFSGNEIVSTVQETTAAKTEDQTNIGNSTSTVVTYTGNTDKNLYILNLANTTPTLWAIYKEAADGTGSYQLDHPADGYFVHFAENASGEYYVSKVKLSSDGDYKLIDSYHRNDNGKYVMASSGSVQAYVKGEAGYDPTNSYDFIGDDAKEALDTVTYDGGFFNKEWFKKEVLNLPGNSRYETDASSNTSGDIDQLKIEVTTLTLEELANLANPDVEAYYGVDLDSVDLIYLSGKGTYTNIDSAVNKDARAAAARYIAKKAFGIIDNAGTRSDASRVPVIMDYSFYTDNRDAGNKEMTNLALTLLRVSDTGTKLAQNIAKESSNGFWTKFLTDTAYITAVNTIIQSAASAAGVQNATSLTLGNGVKEFLTENVFLYDNSTTDYVASDYLTDIQNDTGRAWIYRAVLEEIQYENFLAEKNGTTTKLTESITKASITRYILNWYMHRVTVKSSVRVLDLEPCYDFSTSSATTLTADRVKEFMGRKDTYTGTVNITQMPSAEFIGKIEDLNEKYDMIYLGAQVGAMNTDSSGNTVYNDSHMNGLIYSHVGDYYDYSGEDRNAQNRLRDASLNHKINDDGNDLNNSTNVYRGPGNDMNSTRYKEFKQFVQAGYPVVIADKFLSIANDGQAVASTYTLDKNSYFYQIIDFMVSSKDANGEYLYWQKNVYAESQLLQDSSGLGSSLSERQNTFCNYLNLSKLSIDWVTTLGETAYPEALTYGNKQEQSNQSYLGRIDGKYQLQYIFTLSNDAAASQVTTTYDCKLFVDKNSDGRFAGSDYVEGQTNGATEELTGLKVYLRKGSEWQQVDPSTDSETTHYELQTGNVYKVIRQLPDDYVGVIPWKLVFYDNADRLVRTAQSGYTAVPQQTGKKPIKVLQLLSEKNNNWNLQEDLKNSNSDFYGYISGLKDWEVTVDSITVSELLEKELKIQNYQTSDEDIYRCYVESLAYMQKYDMLILGFSDSYRFGYQYKGEVIAWNNGAAPADSKKDMAVAQAVCDYIESGKSVLFTHDTTSYIGDLKSALTWRKNSWNDDWAQTQETNGWYWGYEINRSIRASVGLDRYGALKNYYESIIDSTSYGPMKQRYQNYLNTLNGMGYDEIKEPNTTQNLGQLEGLTKYTVVRFLKNPLEALRTNRNYTSVYFPVNNALLYDAGYRQSYSDDGWNKPSYMLKGTYGKDSGSELALKATQVNEGQITQYPYLISKDEQKSLKVSATHYQWLQPNMELDRDGDGKSDIVVWYCLSDIYNNSKYPTNIYNICPNDVVNNYYIYNMRNVTYSGAGHSKPDSGAEMKLFVNTIIAAYNAGITAPSVNFKDDKGYDLNSIYVISDPVNNTILKAADQGNIRSTDAGDVVSVKFVAEDDNILSGNPQICVEFYKSAGSDANATTVDGIAEKVVPLNVSSVKDASGNAAAVQNGHYMVGNNLTYTVTYPLSEMGLFNGNSGMIRSDAETTKVYVRVYTLFENGTKATPGNSDSITVSAQELFELN